MKKLLLLVGLVVFLTPSLVSAENIVETILKKLKFNEVCYMAYSPNGSSHNNKVYELGELLITSDTLDFPNEWLELTEKQCEEKAKRNQRQFVEYDNKKVKIYKCVQEECRWNKKNLGSISYYNGETKEATQYDYVNNASNGWKEYIPSPEEVNIKKNISILKMLYNEGEITNQQFDQLKQFIIVYQLTGTTPSINLNKKEGTNKEGSINDEQQLELLKEQLKEMKTQTGIQSNKSTWQTICFIFFGLPDCM